MNRYVKDMLMRKTRDERNPYGSRGGYITSRDPRRRDRAMERDYRDMPDYAHERRYPEMDYNYPRARQDYGYGYGVGMFEYEPEDYRMDGHYRLSERELKTWEKDLENADGTRGAKYDLEQVRQTAQQLGIKFEKFSPELLSAITNMFYSDYCKVLGNDLMLYVKLAKEFLCDEDFDGTPEEKAYLYYTCIVEKE